VSKIKAVFEELKSQWFSKDDDRAWNEWVDTRTSDSMRELVTLIKSDVRPTFKARALFLLLAYGDAYNPIYWKGGNTGGAWSELNYMKSLDMDLIRLAAKLVIAFHEDSKSRPRDGWIVGYEYQMRVLLSLLPEEQAEELFAHYPLNDLQSFYSMDDSSGYNPFRHLLRHKGITDCWKRKADAKVREIIELEESGQRTPRQSHERALVCYTYILSSITYRNQLPYSTEFFADQVEFSATQCIASGYNPYPYANMMNFFNNLQGDLTLSARHQLARLVVLTTDCKHPYVIRSRNSMHEAKIMQADAISVGDDELKTTLDAILVTGRQYLTDAETKKTDKRLAEQTAFNSLR